jgi:hypothetical protein
VQSKTRGSAHFLRLVGSDGVVAAPKQVDNDLSFEADRIAALNGSNPYSDFLREHGHRPDRGQAATIGRLMGARVRASDGSMQPVLTAGERAAIRSIRKERAPRMVEAVRSYPANCHSNHGTIGEPSRAVIRARLWFRCVFGPRYSRKTRFCAKLAQTIRRGFESP